jgi:ppGpp synthetase/RelA/SpoT-type nucleotidyltranferase
MPTSEWEERYQGAREGFEDFCGETRRLVERLLADGAIDVAQIESRTKTVGSFGEKVRRKSGKYADPLAEMTDLPALRVIAYFPADVARIGALLEEHFDVDWPNSRRQSAEAESDRFGYRSDHYVVRMSGARVGLPEYARFDGLRAEIQVRTVMQHAWAAVDHQLRYKNASQLPPELQRRLSKLSALLEVADEQFAALRSEADALQAGYEEEVQQGDFSAEIDLLSLPAYLGETGLAAEWAGRAIQAGFAPAGGPGELGYLVFVLDALGIRTLAQLQPFFVDADRWGVGYLARLAAESNARGFLPVAAPYDVLTFLLLTRAPPEIVLRSPFAGVIDQALLALRGEA